MSLPPGSRLGPYELVALLGAGGMGEVYRALDPRLGRDVALKVLHASGASDPQQLRRFEQEARAVAALNHPNILQVYDTGLHEDAPYIVMELLEGSNLRERMGGQPLPPRRVLDIAIQAARGLAAAHDKKIIHRDLKPENLFITTEGLVKILDFGLAKLAPALPQDAEKTLAQPFAAGATLAGTLLGTTGYMSPEQVNGSEVDARSDLFAFGAILYELVAGRPPFQRPTLVETLHAILKEEPPDPDPAGRLPPALARALHRCLEKDPRRRFQTAADLLFHLEGATLPQSTQTHLRLPWRPRPVPRWLRLAAAAAGLAVLAAGAFLLGRRASAPAPPGYHRLTYRKGVIRSARFSADGQTYVYSLHTTGRTQVLAGRTDGVGARSLGLPEGTEILAISRHGDMALLLRPDPSDAGTLAIAPLSGGAPRERLAQVYEADWSPDGQDLAVIRKGADSHYVVEYPIGHPVYHGPPVTPTLLDNVRVSPRGDRVAFLEHLGIGRESLSVVDRAGRRTVLVEGACETLAWAPDGKRLFFTFQPGGDRHEIRSVTLAGRQQVVATVLGRVRIRDITPSGRLLLDQTLNRTSMVLQGPGSPAGQDLSWLNTSYLADLSADGAQVLFGEPQEGPGPGGAYLRRRDGGDAVRLGDGDPLSLAPDGSAALILSVDARKALSLFPTGQGAPRVLCPTVRADWAVFAAGGSQVLVGGIGPDGEFRVWLQPAAGGAPTPWTAAVPPEAFPVVAPGGAQVALAPVRGRVEIYTLEGRLLRTVRGLREGEIPVQWEPSGQALLLADLTGLPARLTRLDLATGARRPWREVGPPDRDGVDRLRALVVSADGRTLAYAYTRTLASDLYVTDPLP